MSRVRTCDVCGQPTERVAIKMYKASKNAKTDHTNYTHHADVGVCCVMKINAINWQPRQKLGPRKKKEEVQGAA